MLPLPCALWRDSRCSVYGGAQPVGCRAYQCELLKKLESGARTLVECLEIVDRVVTAQHEMDRVGGRPSLAPRKERKRSLDPAEGARLLAVAEYEVLVRRYLKAPKDLDAGSQPA
ncbi:MAG TPA: hypothetical protein VGN51_20725 [Acidimicrobiia bacterium]